MSETDEGRYNAHPAYADGWRDACDGEPLFPDSTVEYAAGWRGWYEAKEALARMSPQPHPGIPF